MLVTEDGSAFSRSELAIAKMYELFCEIGMSVMVLLWLMRHEMNFASILDDIDHHSLFLGHIFATLTASTGAVLIFKSVPLFAFCSDIDPCTCSSFYFPLYGSYCEASAVDKEVRSHMPSDGFSIHLASLVAERCC